ncbi:hypothetical protein OUZ56_009638 [Daphnia magna]|uniref:Uncharacterized protein n=1 Tax=Daphnia magna TaxID=35525 RepID=A0ABR0AH07_9CRUS|nr:hypothetical protein OUZ56_009638 [Daphnia magna]
MKTKVSRKIRLLGKRNTKNSEADYVQRAWRTVFADSLSKDVNWLGRRDKRVNNGNEKKGLHNCRITPVVKDGILSNKVFVDMENEKLIEETKGALKNAKSRFVADQFRVPADEGSDSN